MRNLYVYIEFLKIFTLCIMCHVNINCYIFVCIVFSVSSYRRKHIELYSSHDLFRKENSEAAEIRQLSAQEAQDDATKWLQNGGDVAVSIELSNIFN